MEYKKKRPNHGLHGPLEAGSYQDQLINYLVPKEGGTSVADREAGNTVSVNGRNLQIVLLLHRPTARETAGVPQQMLRTVKPQGHATADYPQFKGVRLCH